METTPRTRTRLHIGLKTADHNTHIHPEEVKKVVKNHVNAGTFYRATGLWKGEFEDSLIFEVLNIEEQFKDSRENVDSVEGLKNLLEQEFNQDSVLVTTSEVDAAF